ncbi:MAG: hypothetical protein ACOC1G_06990 [Phycisphaeraceae bacterium]
MKRFARPLLLVTLLAAAAWLPAGCAELSELELRPLTSDARVESGEVKELSRIPYPQDAPRGPDLDIIVVPGNASIELVNRTASRHRNVRIWINEQYVSPEVTLEIGRGNRIDLRKFINALEEPFPIGTLLAPDKSRPVILAEMYDPNLGLRRRLVVQHDDDDPATALGRR